MLASGETCSPAGVVFALPPGSSKSGCVGPLDKSQNIHTAGFPAGEIRGQILRIE